MVITQRENTRSTQFSFELTPVSDGNKTVPVRYRRSKIPLHGGQKHVTFFFLKDTHTLGRGGLQEKTAKAVGVSSARDVAASSGALVAALVVVCHRRRRVLSGTTMMRMMALRKKFRTNRFLDLVP